MNLRSKKLIPLFSTFSSRLAKRSDPPRLVLRTRRSILRKLTRRISEERRRALLRGKNHFGETL